MSNNNLFSTDTFFSRDFFRQLLKIGKGASPLTSSYEVSSIVFKPINSYSQASTFREKLTQVDLRISGKREDIQNLFASQQFKEFYNNNSKVLEPFLPNTDFTKLTEHKNTIFNFNPVRTVSGNVDFMFNYYDDFYETKINELDNLKKIPPLYNPKAYEQFVSASFSQININNLLDSYSDTVLYSSSSYGLEQLNNSLALSQSLIPHYNSIFISNIDPKKQSKFVDMLMFDPDIEKKIKNKFSSPESKEIFFDPIAARIENFVVDRTSKRPQDYSFPPNNLDLIRFYTKFTEEYFNQYKIEEYFKLEKPQVYETVAYKIKKFIPGSNLPAQEFYVSNLFGIKQGSQILKKDKKDIVFIDNQIKFGGKYRYDVSAVIAFMSFKNYYQIINNQIETVDGGDANVSAFISTKVYSFPYIDMVEIPYFSHRVNCTVAPQNAEVGIYTKKMNDREVIFNLNIIPSIEKPISVKPRDNNIFDLYEKIDDLGNIKFIQNNITQYEIYRIEDQKPISYMDFSDKLYQTIALQSLKTYSFIDNIEPNRKYYYMFRTRVKNFISNPSEVFEVELVNSGGGIYPVIKVLDKQELIEDYVGENIPKSKIKEFGRFFAIYPNSAHLNIVDGQSVGEADTTIPNAFVRRPSTIKIQNTDVKNPSQVWGEKFKIRITSKKTGRKIDINLVFNKKDKDR